MTSVLEMVKPLFPPVTVGVDTMLGILPFYHVYGKCILLEPHSVLNTSSIGAVKLMLFPWTVSVPVVIETRFDPEKFCAHVEKYKITLSLIVPPVLVVLARHPGTSPPALHDLTLMETLIVVEKYDLSSLRYFISGAAPLGAALTKQVHALITRHKKNGTLTFLSFSKVVDRLEKLRHDQSKVAILQGKRPYF